MEQMSTALGFIPDIVELGENDNLALGQGFDSLFGIPTANTIKVSNDRIIPGTFTKTDGVNTVYSLKIVENSSQLKEMLKISASASFKTGIYSAGGSVSSFSEKSINSFDTFIYLDVESTQVAMHINPRELTAAALERTKNSYVNFLEFAGNKCVSGVQEGAKLTVIIRIITGKTESHSAIKADMRARIAGFVGGRASFESTVSSCIENKQTEVFILRKGGADEIPDIKSAIEYSRRIPLIALENPYPITYILSDYRYVDNMPVNYIDENLLEERIEKLEKLLNPYNEFQKYLADLEYADENIELFAIDKDTITEEIYKVRSVINEIDKSVRKLSKNATFSPGAIENIDKVNLERKEITFPREDFILRIYKQENHAGEPLAINESIPFMPSRDWNDAMKSYVLKDGYKATFFVDSQYSGKSITIGGPSNPDTIDKTSPIFRQLSSVKIEKM